MKSRNRLKLTEGGAKALKSWLDANDATLVELGEALETHAMAPKRALRREGLLTLEQLGKVVAFTGGAITAEQLVGAKAARRVPVLAPIQRRRAVPPGALAVEPKAPDAVLAGDAEADPVEMAKKATARNIETLEWLRDHAKSQSLRLKAALELQHIGHGRPAQMERHDPVEYPVTDEVVAAKACKLIEEAKARLVKSEGIGALAALLPVEAAAAASRPSGATTPAPVLEVPSRG